MGPKKKKKKKESQAPFVTGHLKGAVNLTHLESKEQLWHKKDSADGIELI